MHKVLALGVKLIVLVPIASYGHNLTGGLLNGHHVRQRDARGLTLLVLMLVTGQIQVNVHLKETKPIILQGRYTLLFSLLLLDVIKLQ